MPAFGDNPNVACYMDDLYVYLRARAHDAVGRVRPPKREDKPDAYTEAEKSCMGSQMIMPNMRGARSGTSVQRLEEKMWSLR